MKKILTKRTKIENCKLMISGGWGKYGPYIYSGLKTRGGLSIGASIGTRGRELYTSINKKIGQARVKYNMETNNISLRVRSYKKRAICLKKR